MKLLQSIVLMLLVCSTAFSQRISDLPSIYSIDPSDLFLIYVPGAGGYKATLTTVASNIALRITNITATATNAINGASNLAVTNSTSFGVFYAVSGATNLQLFNIKQGTNTVLYRDGSNIVVNASAIGEVTTAQLNTASNAVLSIETTRNAAVSNALVSLIASSGGTNYPPVTTTGTNIVVGTGVEKSLIMGTNTNIGISFNGTEILGEKLTLVVTNTSAVASNIVISFFQDGAASRYFDANVASNVSAFVVVTNSSRRLDFTYNGSFWRLESHLTKEMELAVSGGLSMTTNATSDTVTISTLADTNSFTPVQITGTGGANTNFTLGARQREIVINAFTNVNITSISDTDPSRVDYLNMILTNGSGANTSFSWPMTVNSARWASVYGTNALTVLTNMTATMVSMRISGTNVQAGFATFTWP